MVAYYDTITGKIYNFDVGGTIPSITDDFVEIDATEYYDLLSQTYADSSKIITFDTEAGGLTLSDAVFSEEPLDDFEIINTFKSSISFLLDGVALSYGYSSIENAISYYDSLDSTKREEARSFSGWRDSVEFLADSNIFSFTADGVTLPDLAGFTGQTGYAEFSVVPIPTILSGDENAGYHITDLENGIFTAWTKSNSDSSGFGTVLIPFPSGQIQNVYSITGLVDQGGLTTNWLTSNYTIKIKTSGTQNSFGAYTQFDYMINDVENNTLSYSGLLLRFNIIGKF